MRQLDLFGITEEEKPVKQQENALANEQVPVAEAAQPLPPGTPDKEPEQPVVETPIAVEDNDTVDEDVIEFSGVLFTGNNINTTAEPRVKTGAAVKGRRGRKSFKEIDAEIALVEVPGDEELFQKLYYPISQVAKWFNVNTSLLRFWENEFDILKPRKNRKGDRMFRPEDIKNLQVIYYLLRQRKFSIEGAKKYIKQNKSRAEVNIQLIQSLTKFRSFLLELKANLEA
ncbi:MAG TPA: MerR family transcriptional regulator [Chitinophagaceae bacterium]|nr:MerR family transcriptional regulator [Chitinophagaceae bacterium]